MASHPVLPGEWCICDEAGCTPGVHLHALTMLDTHTQKIGKYLSDSASRTDQIRKLETVQDEATLA
jgi:hypothetical protein